MDLEALQHGNFSQLGEAVTDWTQMIGKLEKLKDRAENELDKKSKKANWSGVNATVTREFITKTAKEFGDAVTQARSIRNILRDTRDELIGYRGDLQDAIDRALKKKISVMGIGGGKFLVSSMCTPDEDQPTEGAINAVKNEIQGILAKATESDDSAAKALRALADQAKYGFSGAEYKDRDSAAEALAEAEHMAKLAKKDPEKLTARELATLTAGLKKYRNDELFSERFAVLMGPKGTLGFWAGTADTHARASGAELDQLKELQKNLSMTLATATHSDSAAMQEWKRDIINEGNTSFRPDPSDPYKSPLGVRGFQVMSSLMSHGKYDTEFLDDYGKKLLKADMAPRGSVGTGTNEVWENADQSLDLVFGKGAGGDPVIGFMDALSHNSEAATNTFDSKATLDHVLQSTKYTDRGVSVGHALEAAVTGVSRGETPSEPVPHSKTQVTIMKNIMNAVAQPDGGADLVKKGIGGSFGHMASAYMPEINRTMAGQGAESIFLTNSAAPDDLERTDATRFLYEVARDTNGKAALLYGEGIYTSSVLEAHIADPDLHDSTTNQKIGVIAKNAGVIDGIIAHSTADAEISEAKEGEKDWNESVKREGDYYKSVVSAGLGVGAVALAPQNLTGAMAGAAGGGFFGGIAGMAVDRFMEGREQDKAEDSALYGTGKDLNKAQDDANWQTQQSARNAIERHDSALKKGSIDVLINDKLNDGWQHSDTILEDAHRRPSA
ncbi:hypothetical protein [Streptomyces chattanoogensis]|uniref:Uncharacterized protein n=1 Tax=Streptomyces chattanoogensis TaxID=66876 RepID=A0A0N0XT75_9ACTN|nr:hypothetical protein [Streptomyces chattanoogensis]KPC61314.1 hypothetical protein ADL29_24895 [Streptomyces chattanoogensis]